LKDYLHHESKTKELSLLCFLKGINIDENSQEQKILQVCEITFVLIAQKPYPHLKQIILAIHRGPIQ